MMTKAVNCQILLFILLFYYPASGTIINVPNDQGTIQQGIDAAFNGDTVFIENGIYSGADNRNLSIPFGRNIVIQGEDADLTIIDLVVSSFDGFRFDFTQENNNTIIENLTIRNGRRGVSLVESGPILRNLKLVNNIIGVYHSMPFGIIRAKHCDFYGNDTGLVSYAWSETSFEVDSCSFINNDYGVFGSVTISWSQITGGISGIGCDVTDVAPGTRIEASNCFIHDVSDTAIHVGNYFNIVDSRIQNNPGPMIAHGNVNGTDYARLYMTNCFVNDNTGGIFVWGLGGSSFSTLEMTNTRYSNNTRSIWYIGSGTGGATIDNCYINENDSTGLDLSTNNVGVDITVSNTVVASSTFGSGIMLNSNGGDMTVFTTTVNNNQEFGIYVWNSAGALKIDSSIVSNNGFGVFLLNPPGESLSFSCNDVFDNTSANYGGNLSDQTGINGNISVPPMFCSAADGDFHLLLTSPCAAVNNCCGAQIGAHLIGCNELVPLVITGYSPLINMTVTDPDGYTIGLDASGVLTKTIFPSTYIDGPLTDVITINYPIEGTYAVEVVGQSYAIARADRYAIGIRIDGTNNVIMTANTVVPEPGESDYYNYVVEEEWHPINGDANRDENVDILDIIYLINFKYKGGPAPYPIIAGEGNCIEPINILDIIYLINYKYKAGPEPCATLE